MPIRDSEKGRYPKDWKAISTSVKEEQGWCCKWCGARHGEPHPFTGSKVILTTAHLDHQPENCAKENLAALCQLCHNRYDAPHRRQGIRDRAGIIELPLDGSDGR